MASEMSNENNTKELENIEGKNISAGVAHEVVKTSDGMYVLAIKDVKLETEKDALTTLNLYSEEEPGCSKRCKRKHWKIGKFGQGPLQFPLMLPPPGGTTPPDIG